LEVSNRVRIRRSGPFGWYRPGPGDIAGSSAGRPIPGVFPEGGTISRTAHRMGIIIGKSINTVILEKF
jgi:hypothetical protein